MQVKDAIVGFKFEKLTIINLLNERNNHNKLLVECQCDCGKIVKVTINNLGGQTSSCGCFKSQYLHDTYSKGHENDIIMKTFSSTIRKTANSDLTPEYIKEKVFTNCFFCNQPANEVGKNGSLYLNGTEYKKSLGLDRINNQIGYYISNVVPCCFPCNRIKYSSSIDFIINYYNKISINAFKLSNGSRFNYDTDINLIYNHTENCNCFGENSFKVSLETRAATSIASKSKSENHIVNLTINQIKKIIFSPECFYCERSLMEIGTPTYRNGYSENPCSIKRMGIDRINSTGQYDIDNVINCCKYCNNIKGDTDIYDFAIKTKQIYSKIVQWNKNNEK